MYESPEKIIMIDDGTGRDIHIPVLMISQNDGERIKTWLEGASESERENAHFLLEFNMVQFMIK